MLEHGWGRKDYYTTMLSEYMAILHKFSKQSDKTSSFLYATFSSYSMSFSSDKKLYAYLQFSDFALGYLRVTSIIMI